MILGGSGGSEDPAAGLFVPIRRGKTNPIGKIILVSSHDKTEQQLRDADRIKPCLYQIVSPF